MIGVVTGTPVGEALAKRLQEDGRELVAGRDRDSLATMASSARLIVLDADPATVTLLARTLGDFLDGNHLIAHTVRGLPGGAGATEIVRAETPVARVGVIGGPLAPADLLEGRPTAAVIASRHPEVVDEFARALSTPKLRIYRGRDPIGVELASGLGELVALGWGVASALGFGGPTRAVVLVRAVRELSRLISAVGGDPATASGLAGLGDLLVRGADPASDAYRLGAQLASGGKLDGDGRSARLVEGARAVRALARRHGVQVHIFAGLADLLEGKLDAEDLVGRLMALPVLDD